MTTQKENTLKYTEIQPDAVYGNTAYRQLVDALKNGTVAAGGTLRLAIEDIDRQTWGENAIQVVFAAVMEAIKLHGNGQYRAEYTEGTSAIFVYRFFDKDAQFEL